jgi:DNA-binding transcriptional LysR family regulator
VTLAALGAFARAAELGSFAAAARQLDMSPAAVGQAVQRLESAFGVKLLARTTRRMTVTPEGRLLRDRCRGIFAEVSGIERIFEESRAQLSGPLRISAPTGIARRHVLPLVARFVAQHAGVDVTLDCSDAVRDFAADATDVAIRILRPTDSSVIARRLARIEAVTVASPAYLRRHGAPRDLADAARRRFVLYRHPATGELAPVVFRRGAREVTVRPTAALTTNDVDTAIESAALGLGLAQPPATYVAADLASGRLVQVLERHVATPWSLWLCWGSAKHLPLRVRAFVDFVREEWPKDD